MSFIEDSMWATEGKCERKLGGKKTTRKTEKDGGDPHKLQASLINALNALSQTLKGACFEWAPYSNEKDTIFREEKKWNKRVRRLVGLFHCKIDGGPVRKLIRTSFLSHLRFPFCFPFQEERSLLSQSSGWSRILAIHLRRSSSTNGKARRDGMIMLQEHAFQHLKPGTTASWLMEPEAWWW